MQILGNLHEKIKIYEPYMKNYNEDYPDLKESIIEELKNCTKCNVPDDYIVFLKELNKINNGESIEVVIGDGHSPWAFDSCEDVVWCTRDFQENNLLGSDDILPIGGDMGDDTLFYGNGKEGFGIYLSGTAFMNFEDGYARKVANSITEILVDGVGMHILDN